MEVLELQLPDQVVEIAVTGPDHGRPVLYFHSPSTSGQELEGARLAAERLQIRLFTLRRSSVSCDAAARFVETVARTVVDMVQALALDHTALVGWSGGAPYALASAANLGSRVSSIHLVSPVPGPLTGPNAVPDQSPRLQQVANTTASSPWSTGPSTLRDYKAIAAPWTFDLESVEPHVTIWAPTDDDIVPVRAVQHLKANLARCDIIEVSGAHDWFTGNWSTVLQEMID